LGDYCAESGIFYGKGSGTRIKDVESLVSATVCVAHTHINDVTRAMIRTRKP